ncbi:MAG: putative baseplate assembly protein [Lysobacter sp.]|nr:putative baseplate assembly protein [Lysobacter sp.]
MPLPKPILDDRNFEQLVEESRNLLPRAAPAWTDHNISDPGITQIELLAWLCEMDLYRLDRTPDEAVRGFLRLAGITPAPAQVAQAVVTIATAMQQSLPVGLQLRAAGDGPVFQTIEAVDLTAAKLVAVINGAGDDVTLLNEAGAATFLPFGTDAKSDTACTLGFDAPFASPSVRLQAWTPTPEADAGTRRRLVAEYEDAERERSETCPVTLRDNPPWWLHYDVRTVWEYFAADGVWKALPDVVDETRALTLTGPIRFGVPADHVPGGAASDGLDPSLHYVRCRILHGGFECASRLSLIAVNAVPAAHAADVPMAMLGVSRGHAQQRHVLPQSPVVPSSTRLTVTLGADVENDWREVREWDLSGPHDRDYRVEPERALIEFGNGHRGAVAAAQSTLELHYQVGGSTPGNVQARSLEIWLDAAHNQMLLPNWSLLAPTLVLQQPFAASGGAEAESLKAAVARAIETASKASTALTLADFERAALETPGVPVGRARALANYFPALPCFLAAGSISVVVIPDCPGPRPMPSDGMRAAVHRHLARRRSPGTELHVIAPGYVTVRVFAKLHAERGAVLDALRDIAIAALDAYLNPLHGGPAGEGWPVGRDVYRSEVLALLAALPGVVSVTGLGLQGEGDDEPRCGNVPLCKDNLPASGAHRLVIAGAPPLRLIDRSHPHECP